MKRRTKKQIEHEALLRDMAAIAAKLEKAGAGASLPAEDLMAAMATGSEPERRARLRRITACGWVDANETGTAWLRGHGRFRLGFVTLWRLEIEDLDAGDRRRP